jgi:hypothetical protein
MSQSPDYKTFEQRSHESGLVRMQVNAQVNAQILNEGSKGLLLVNGGGAAALAAFLQAIWDKPNAAPMRWWVLFGMCWLLLGTALSAVIFLARYFGAVAREKMQPAASRWWQVQLSVTLLSVACFVTGMAIVVAGGFVVLRTPAPAPTHAASEHGAYAEHGPGCSGANSPAGLPSRSTSG